MNLMDYLIEILDCISSQKKAIVQGLNINFLEKYIDELTAHHVEGIAFESIDGFESMVSFFDNTYKLQLKNVADKLANTLNECDAVFIQGFSRYEELSEYYTQGIRGDIDLYLPENQGNNFNIKAKEKDFFPYVFDDENIFIPDESMIKKIEESYWVKKEFTLKLLEDALIPHDLPIEIDASYFPYVYRNDKWKFMTTIEVHHFYINEIDGEIINENKIIWSKYGFYRINLTATVFFSLVRLYHGVKNGEKRMRIVVDIACSLMQKKELIDYKLLERMFYRYPENERWNLICVCKGLMKLHNVFMPLNIIGLKYESINNVWLEEFVETLGEKS